MTTEVITNLPIPPGEYLEEVLEEQGMSKGELALRMGRPAAKLSAVFNGDKAITPDTALQLERATGVPAHVWTGLETEYRLAQARQKEEQREEEYAAEIPLVTLFCYAQLLKNGMVQSYTRGVDKVKVLQRFFGVMSLQQVLAIPRYAVAHRHGSPEGGDRSPESVAAWLRVGEVEAMNANCEPFSQERLYAILPKLRGMTSMPAPQLSKSLRDCLAQAGVALVFCPHFPKTKAQGATFFAHPGKAVVMLSLRYKWADIFWFTLFHELGHILLHHQQLLKSGAIIEDKHDDKQERESDDFAKDTLITPADWNAFTQKGLFSNSAIKTFSSSVHVAPGIVVGRLQHEKWITPFMGNELRQQYCFVKEAAA